MSVQKELQVLYPAMSIRLVQEIQDGVLEVDTLYGTFKMNTATLLKGKVLPLKVLPEKTRYVIDRFKEKHGGRFDYSNVVYRGSKTNVAIVCHIHGSFKQTPNAHLLYSGCPKCGKELEYKLKTDTQEVFLEKAKKVHGDKYDYSEVVYKNSYTKISIRCAKHGIFSIKPKGLLNGTGCRECGYESLRLTKESFVKRASEKHKNYYDYSKTVVNFSSDKSIITCRHHGDFIQDVSDHITGRGCPVCANIISNNKSVIIENIESSKNTYCEFYILKYTNSEEVFYKVGVTKNLKNRMGSLSNSFKYAIEILHVEVSNVYDAYQKEHFVKTKLKKFNHIPLHKFSGFTECFNINPINFINETVS